MSEEFTPGTLVLAKMKGYPAWPGMVLDETLISADLMNSKPKASERWPVRFLNDTTYMWATASNLQALSKDTVEKFLAKPQKASKSLIEAYRLSQNPPAHRELAQPPAPPAKTSSKKTAAKNAKSSSTSVSAAKKETPKKEAAKKETVTSKKTASSTASSKDSATSNKRKQPASVEKATTAPAKKQKTTVTSKDNSPDVREQKVQNARRVLQKTLFGQTEPTEDQMDKVDEQLTVLEDLPNLEVSIIRKVKINKVLRCIVSERAKIPLEEKFHFKDRSQKLLESWSSSSELAGAESPLEKDGELKSEKKEEPKEEAKEESREPADETKEFVTADESLAADEVKEDVAQANGTVA